MKIDLHDCGEACACEAEGRDKESCEMWINYPEDDNCALKAIEKHGPMTSKDIARLLKKNSHNVCGTIRHAVDAGLVVKKAHVRSRNGGKGHMNCWLYQIAA